MSEESIRAKLNTLAKDTGMTFMELFRQLTFERFLARVSSSAYRDNLIFKGGLCLKQYLDTGRETKDIDFLIKKLSADKDEIEKVFSEIAKVDREDLYSFFNVKVTMLEDEHKQYPGFRVNLDIALGKMKDKIQIDVGVGDIVDEYEMAVRVLTYREKPIAGLTSISLMAYPPEFIFSEKLQAIVMLQALNSRMKDYFDCYMLIVQNQLGLLKCKTAIQKTFKNRNTEIQLIGDYYSALAIHWGNFRRKVESAPDSIEIPVKAINDFLVKIYPSIDSNDSIRN